uniref:Uncharacterized protein n=1 Tax=viral metagenome TaxID=1070528 RepID=A0A6C0D3S5_9ZZZZ
MNPTTRFILNYGLPECKNCVYFIPDESEKYKYPLGRCKLYGVKNLVSGIIRHEYADHCRQSKNQCSITALHYEAINEQDNTNLDSTKKLNDEDSNK